MYSMKKKEPVRQKGPQLGSQTAEGSGNYPEGERKDHVLQARVPLSLYNNLVDQARRLRVPVSNLVRNILEDSTRMVENIVDSGIEIAEAISGGVNEEDLSSVLGWQPMIANKRLACSRRGCVIEKGSEAFMSVGASGSRTFVICEGCKCEI
jgi:hypothetical protein